MRQFRSHMRIYHGLRYELTDTLQNYAYIKESGTVLRIYTKIDLTHSIPTLLSYEELYISRSRSAIF